MGRGISVLIFKVDVVKKLLHVAKISTNVVKVEIAKYILVGNPTENATEQSEQAYSKHFPFKVYWEDHAWPASYRLAGVFIGY